MRDAAPRLDFQALRADTRLHLALTGGALAALTAAAAAEDILTVRHVIATLLGYAVLAVLVLRGIAAHRPQQQFGAANALTLARGAAVLALAALAVEPLDDRLAWLACLLGLACIALDGVDGCLARLRATASAFGARFDMEVDAFFVLALSVLLVTGGKVGAWILLAGAARYVFVVAGWRWPALAGPLPYSERRRVACVVQCVTLAVALSPAATAFQAAAIAGAGLAVILYSFAVDTVWLLRRNSR